MVTAQPAPPSKGWKGDEDLASKVMDHRAQKKTWLGILGLAYGSLGVVYGDIGTSPLYVYESIFADNEITKSDVAGGISLVFWTLTLLALVKYTLIVPFANDDGEGGTFALYTFLCRNIGIAPHGPIYATDRRTMLHLASVRRFSDGALKLSNTPIWKRFAINGSAVRRWIRAHVSAQRVLFITTIIATAMILGDGVLTPSISVLSAISGLEVADDAITQDVVVGVSIAILVLLFGVQFLGTQKVTFAFAPIIVLWLTSNAVVGIYNMVKHDGAAAWSSLDPGKGINFLVQRGESGWRLLGAVMLCVTGSEAMFLDMGHFSHAGIALGFGCFAYPCLVLTYVGQGAWLMDKLNAKQLFYKSVPHAYFYPMLVLAALASIVASQALISGSFSIIRQACNVGAFPRLRVKNTGKNVEGQIYIAPVNWVLMLLCVAVVAGFQSTVALGNAYGVAVMAVFVITTLLTVLVMIACWELSLFLVVPFALVYLAIECTFLSALLTKVPDGAWFTIAMAGTIAFIKIVWWMGTLKKHRGLAHEYGVSLEDMLVLKAEPGAAQGTAEDGTSTATQGKEKVAGIAEEIEGSTSTPPQAPKPRTRRLQLALCRPGGEPMSLARLRGIGIYYSDSPVGVPPVLVHFLRNVQALHEVSIFLTVRTLPVPYIERHDRLLVRVLPSAPHFYQVVARYGYMDEVDHSVKFMTHLVEAIAHHMRSVADMQAVEAATALAADIAADSVRLGTRPSSDGRRSRRLESISVHHIEYELGVRNSVEPTGASYNVTPTFGSLARMSAVKTDVLLPAGAMLTTSSRGAPYTVALSRLASKPSSGGTAPPPPLPTTPEPERPIRGSNSRVPMELADGVVAISLTASSAASTQSTKDTADFLMHVMAHHGVVYYVGRTTPRAPRDGSLVAELSYGALYRTMDSLTQTDVYEQWSIPLDQLVELSLSVFV